MLTFFLTGAATLLLVYAALHDFAARTVPNWLPLCVAGIGCVARLADHSLLPSLAVAGITFVFLFAIWFIGAIGGGDVKLWAATALLIPPQLRPEVDFFLDVVVIGGLLGLLYLGLWLGLRTYRRAGVGSVAPPGAGRARLSLFRRVLRVEARRIARRGPLPYAFAIAGSAIITLLPVHFQH